MTESASSNQESSCLEESKCQLCVKVIDNSVPFVTIKGTNFLICFSCVRTSKVEELDMCFHCNRIMKKEVSKMNTWFNQTMCELCDYVVSRCTEVSTISLKHSIISFDIPIVDTNGNKIASKTYYAMVKDVI